MTLVKKGVDQARDGQSELGFLSALSSVVAVIFSREGEIKEANLGMKKLAASSQFNASEDLFHSLLMNPSFEEINSNIEQATGEVIFEGLITMGGTQGPAFTLNGAIVFRNDDFLLVAEHDVEMLDSLNATVVGLNEELADMQRELVRANRELQRKEKVITEMMLTDPLTSLPNRRYLNQVLEREISHAERSGKGLSIAIVDIDHFKHVNDTYGHDVGDEVLGVFSSHLRDLVRTDDFVARFGGEEFVIVFTGTRIDQALTVAHRIQQDLAGNLLDGVDEEITSSFGLAEYKKGMSVQDILHNADVALYKAKEQGRNRVAV